MIHDIPTCAELISRIEREAIETLQQASSLIVSEDSTTQASVGNSTNNPGAEMWGIGKSKL